MFDLRDAPPLRATRIARRAVPICPTDAHVRPRLADGARSGAPLLPYPLCDNPIGIKLPLPPSGSGCRGGDSPGRLDRTDIDLDLVDLDAQVIGMQDVADKMGHAFAAGARQTPIDGAGRSRSAR